MNWHLLSRDDVRRVMVNPFYAIQISPTLSVGHEPIISREEWIKANTSAIQEEGAVLWLETLLSVL